MCQCACIGSSTVVGTQSRRFCPNKKSPKAYTSPKASIIYYKISSLSSRLLNFEARLIKKSLCTPLLEGMVGLQLSSQDRLTWKR